MSVACEHCGTLRPEESLFSKGRCSACGSLLEPYQPRWARDPDGAFPRPPRGLHVELGEPPTPAVPTYRTAPKAGGGRTLTIDRSWFSTHPLSPFIQVFSLLWNSSLVTFMFLFMLFPMVPVDSDDGSPMILGALFLAGLGPTYWALAAALNRTAIHVGDRTLTVRHGPLPWRGRRDLPTRPLRLAYVRRKEVRGDEGNVSIFYEVLADTGETPAPLLTGLCDRDQAYYIAWAIREHLGLDPVADGVDAARAAR